MLLVLSSDFQEFILALFDEVLDVGPYKFYNESNPIGILNFLL